MILEIRFSNFFSIKDEIILDMRAGNIKSKTVQTLDQNTFEFNGEKLLKTVALYGANASGKSNIIKAINFCCAMVFQSQNHTENTTFNFVPFKFNGYQNQASTFFIRFVCKNIEFEYSFSLTQTEIQNESLYYYPNSRKALVFSRNETVKGSKKEKYSFGSAIKRPFDVAENTSVKTLYISRASQLDRELATDIFMFFANTFILGFPLIDNSIIEKLYNENRNVLLLALQKADSDIVNIQMSKQEINMKAVNTVFPQNIATINDQKGIQLRFTTFHKEAPDVPFDFLTEESEGTKKLFVMLLTIVDIIKNNKILIVDEIETSLHSEILEFVLSMFHAGNSAQLIFSTHNTNILDLKKMRKDQIYFVNKKSDASSDLYSLIDFKDFRESMNAEKAYLEGRFDAVPFVDTSVNNLKSLIYES